MNSDLRKKQNLLIISVAVYISLFTGGFYFSLKKLSDVREGYIAKRVELFNLEEKQKRSSELARVFSDNADRIEEIEKALVQQTFENKQELIFAIESIAKTLNLEEYNIVVTRTLISQDIAAERAQQARARKRTNKESSDEISESKFPSVSFKVSFTGLYEDIVGFVERLQLLPYYMQMDDLAISGSSKKGDNLAKLNASINFTIFTK